MKLNCKVTTEHQFELTEEDVLAALHSYVANKIKECAAVNHREFEPDIDWQDERVLGGGTFTVRFVEET